MPILNIKMDNILSFNDFELNLSHPKKTKNSLIKDEFVSDFPKINYKKLNIFIGANASGKTSLIRSVWNILIFICKKERSYIDSIIRDKNFESNVELDFIFGNMFYRIKILVEPIESDSKISVAYNSIELKYSYSYNYLIKKIDKYYFHFMDYIEALNKLEIGTGWLVTLPGTEKVFDQVDILKLDQEEEILYSKILNIVLKSFDPSIVQVTKSKDTDDAYVIDHSEVGKIIVQNGMNLTDLNKLSSGTKYAFNIAKIIYCIKKQKNGIYLIDEQFSYVNSDLEKAYISLIALLIGNDEQVFITTHNNEVLDLKLPFHAFNFMKKEKDEHKTYIVCNNAAEVENRNNVSAKIIVDNDIFGISPNIDKIIELGEINE